MLHIQSRRLTLPLHEGHTASWASFRLPQRLGLVLQDTSRKELYGDLLPVEGRQRRLGWVHARTIYLDKAVHDVRTLPQFLSACRGVPVLPWWLLAVAECILPSLAICPQQQCHRTATAPPACDLVGLELVGQDRNGAVMPCSCLRIVAMLATWYMIEHTTGCPPRSIVHWSCAGFH